MSGSAIKIPRQAGIYVRHAREGQGLTRAQLAKSAGVSERLVASLELGESPGIRLDKLMAILRALDMRLEVSENSPTASGSSESASKDVQAAGSGPDVIAASTVGATAHSHDEAIRQFILENYGASVAQSFGVHARSEK